MSATEILGALTGSAPLALGYLVAFVPIGFLVWWKLHRRRRLIEASKAAGEIARIDSPYESRLPVRYAAVASIGTGGTAPMTLDDHILRPSLGVRVMIMALSASVIAFVFTPGLAPGDLHAAMEELPGPVLLPQLVLLAVVANGLLYIFGNEARYNRDKLIVTRFFFHRREYRWKDLDWIGDTGAYDLVLQFQPGGKAKVLRHSRGIEDFKMFAKAQLKRDRPGRA